MKLVKIPKGEALVLAKYGTDVYMKLDPSGEPEGHYIVSDSESRAPHTRRGSVVKNSVVPRDAPLVLRPGLEQRPPARPSRLARAVDIATRMCRVATEPVKRDALQQYVAKEMSVDPVTARSMVSEMIHRYNILRVA